MDLNDCKFYHSGDDMNFSVKSDVPCKVIFRDSIRLVEINPNRPMPCSLADPDVEIYAIEPGQHTLWVTVHETSGKEKRTRFFKREGDRFVEGKSELKIMPVSEKKKIGPYGKPTNEFKRRSA